MDQYDFHFNPKNCDKMYFKELFLLLNSVEPEKEDFKRIPKSAIAKLNIKCDRGGVGGADICQPDEFFFEDKKQIVLGRLFDTIGCYSGCKGHYFGMAMEPFSLFKNDVFIRYIIDKPHLYINNSKKIELEHVFPIRILLSDTHDIPTFSESRMNNINEYTFDYIKKKIAVSPENLASINRLPETSLIKRIITNKNPIISREFCMLYYMKLHFYIVRDGEGKGASIKPFILVSKYNLSQIKKFYKKHEKPLPQLRYLFGGGKQKTRNKPTSLGKKTRKRR